MSPVSIGSNSGFTIAAGTPNYVPIDAGQRVSGLLSLTIVQVDTILSLISLPENSRIQWWENYNYIENLHDGRGYTVSIFGATSGTGDLVDVFDKLRKRNSTHPLLRFYDELKKTRGDDVSKLQGLLSAIQGLGNDKDWRGAVWDVYVNEYWTFVAQFCNKTQGSKNRPGPVIKTPLVKGFIVDTAINHGPDLESFQVILNKMKNKNNGDEKEWFKDFAQARHDILESGFEDLDTSGTGDRCTLWLGLGEKGNWELKRPIQPYAGYWAN
eukprot:Em0015g423a